MFLSNHWISDINNCQSKSQLQVVRSLLIKFKCNTGLFLGHLFAPKIGGAKITLFKAAFKCGVDSSRKIISTTFSLSRTMLRFVSPMIFRFVGTATVIHSKIVLMSWNVFMLLYKIQTRKLWLGYVLLKMIIPGSLFNRMHWIFCNKMSNDMVLLPCFCAFYNHSLLSLRIFFCFFLHLLPEIQALFM